MIKGLKKTYQNKVIFKDVNLAIPPKEISGLVGPSGEGKTTFLRCLQGLEGVDEGTISFDGKIGLIHQDFQLFPHMTVLENIAYAPHKVLKMSKEKSQKEAFSLLKQFGLAEKADSYPHSLSGGQKQRVAILRALAIKTDFLLLDEPTSALDLKSKEDVMNLLKEFNKLGLGFFIVSHDFDFIQKLCKNIYYLKDASIKPYPL